MEIKELEGFKAVRFDEACVAVIAYTLDANGMIQNIGIVKEKNPHFESGYSENIVMGAVEKEDTSLLQRAMIELKEEAGIELNDSLKWKYIGEIYTTKISPDPIYLFSVNATNVEREQPKGDNGGIEQIISFSFIPPNEALKMSDSIVLSAFFKLFMQLYQKDILQTP
jgi:8-oxo-dGTP pyrophosphatase MutT (NUDIX family)